MRLGRPGRYNIWKQWGGKCLNFYGGKDVKRGWWGNGGHLAKWKCSSGRANLGEVQHKKAEKMTRKG